VEVQLEVECLKEYGTIKSLGTTAATLYLLVLSLKSIKCFYKGLLTSADVTKFCTETQPKIPIASNAGVEARWLGKTP
jgi:hypothetical protein